MATKSFERDMVIRTEAAARALVDAMEDDCSRRPIKPMDLSEELERGRSFIKKRYFL